MNYDFDSVINRQGTSAYKYDKLQEFFGRTDLLPLWIADMDFATPPCILESLHKRLEHPILGYTREPDEWSTTIVEWQRSHHGWNIDPRNLRFINGIIKGLGLAIAYLVAPDEKIIIQPPVYHMFSHVINGNRRQLVRNPLRERPDGLYDMDFAHLESIIDSKCRMLILANPHNPGGVCWSRETLQRLADICYRNNIIVVSDEIHADMTVFGHRHIPFASVSEKAAQCSITFGAPTKVFNMPGIVSAWCVIANDELRDRFFHFLESNELTEGNLFAMPAAVAAYQHGEEWRQAMLKYVEQNIIYVEDYCRTHMPQIRPIRPEASFLVWLDCRQLRLNDDQLQSLFINRAKLALNAGCSFGCGGEGHMRLNVATPRSILQQALDQLCEALKQ